MDIRYTHFIVSVYQNTHFWIYHEPSDASLFWRHMIHIHRFNDINN